MKADANWTPYDRLKLWLPYTKEANSDKRVYDITVLYQENGKKIKKSLDNITEFRKFLTRGCKCDLLLENKTFGVPKTPKSMVYPDEYIAAQQKIDPDWVPRIL